MSQPLMRWVLVLSHKLGVPVHEILHWHNTELQAHIAFLRLQDDDFAKQLKTQAEQERLAAMPKHEQAAHFLRQMGFDFGLLKNKKRVEDG
ncbi:hypothetical protein [Alysiella crassa]|nr:hypothetical protein [Alysiella crassa]UOP06516.1 hypothetical protein LVJ80_12270 [Alysiella crassa]